MIRERITLNYEALPAFYHQLQTHPLYIDLVPTFESGPPARLNFKPQSLFPQNYRQHKECRRGLDLSLKNWGQANYCFAPHHFGRTAESAIITLNNTERSNRSHHDLTLDGNTAIRYYIVHDKIISRQRD
jgi:hypothetical protein